MKYIKNYLFAIAVAALAVAACDKTTVPAYEKAPATTNEQVFFPASVGDQIKMADGETSFTIPVQRGTANLEAIDVAIAASGEGIEYFTVPGTVSFASNAKTANLTIKVTDPVALGKNNFYPITLTIADESMTTPYGRNSITFTAGIELPWIKFDSGIYYSFWNEVELERTMEYQQISENMRYCRIQNFWDDEDDPMDIFWYWDTKTDICFILPTVLQPYDGSNNCVMSDMASFYTKYMDWEGDVGEIGSDEWFAWAGPWMASRGDIPYYDGNGTFHLADWFYIASAEDGVPTGRGWQFGGDGDWFKGNSFGDYTLEVTYAGMFVTPKSDAYPVINFASTKASAKYFDTVKYLIAPQGTDPAEIEAIIVAEASEEIGTITLENMAASIQPELEPGKYVLVAIPYVKGDKNDKGESNEYKTLFTAVLNFTFTGLTGENTSLVEGAYSMEYAGKFATTFNVIGTEDPTQFFVESLGIPNGALWYAEYDPDALTLTLDGYEYGYESYGNQFGSFYGYFDAEKTQVYAICVYNSEESEGDDELVFSVDKGTRELTRINQDLTVEVYLLADKTFLGYYNAFPAGTPVVKAADTAAAPARRNFSMASGFNSRPYRGGTILHKNDNRKSSRIVRSKKGDLLQGNFVETL